MRDCRCFDKIRQFLLCFASLVQNILIYVTCALAGKTPLQGAQTTIYCAVSEEMEGVSGKFVVDCKIKKPNPQALDDEIAERLWKVSAELVGLE